MKERQTRTGRYITGRSSKAGFDGVSLVPPGTFADPTFIPRLSWRAQPAKVEYEWTDVVATVKGAPAGTAFVCDTSLFDDATDSRLWTALLGSPGKLHLTPRVLQELDPWFASRPHHPVKIAVNTGAETVVEVDYDGWSEGELGGYRHYVNLLGLRKGAMRLTEMRFERKAGRPPVDSDARSLRADVQTQIRGYRVRIVS